LNDYTLFGAKSETKSAVAMSTYKFWQKNRARRKMKIYDAEFSELACAFPRSGSSTKKAESALFACKPCCNYESLILDTTEFGPIYAH
jgi:hypothetical protein